MLNISLYSEMIQQPTKFIRKVFRCVCKTEKGDYWFLHVRLSVCLSVCLSVHPSSWNNSTPTRRILIKFYSSISQKSVEKIQIFDVLLTVHLSITLVNDQLDAQFFYFIICLLQQSSTCFEQRRAHHQEVKLY